MYKIIAKQNYTDKYPEYIENYNNGKEIEYNEYGEAKIKQDDFYLINNTERAETIKKSGLAEVKMITKTKGRKE